MERGEQGVERGVGGVDEWKLERLRGVKWRFFERILLLLEAIAEGVRMKDWFVLCSSEPRGEVADEDVHIFALGFGGEVGRKKEEKVAMI